MAKSYEELKFTDDFMFGKVMEDKDLCRDVLECLLEHPVGELMDVISEKYFQFRYEGKPIRLDVYSRDDESIYDAEMQNLNHKGVESLELAFRCRFYQAMADSDALDKGEPYGKLPGINVLFLCTFDPFKKGFPQYTFESRCREDTELMLENKVVNIFFNCTCSTQELGEEKKALYEYIQTGTVQSELVRRIHAAVEKVRKNEKWRSDYMKELALFQDLREEGREEGREIKAREVYEKLIARGMSEEEARELSGWEAPNVAEVL